MRSKETVIRIVQECFESRLIDDSKPLHDLVTVQLVYNGQRQASNVGDDFIELTIAIVVLPFVSLDDLRNVLLRFQNHPVISLMCDCVTAIFN